MAKKKEPNRCSFCGISQEESLHLLAGKSANICDRCVALCNDALSKKQVKIPESNKSKNISLLTPQEIHQQLNQYIIGQEEVKKILSVAVYTHYKRLSYNFNRQNELELDKSNILLIGPTGTGKTLLASTLAKIV